MRVQKTLKYTVIRMFCAQESSFKFEMLHILKILNCFVTNSEGFFLLHMYFKKISNMVQFYTVKMIRLYLMNTTFTIQ